MNKKIIYIVTALVIIALIGGFANLGSLFHGSEEDDSQPLVSATPVGPSFDSDSAYRYCKEQCDFGPRIMNSRAHDECEQYIISKFESFGLETMSQKTTLRGYDGTMLRSTNIIASYKPEATTRVLLCAHWDSRPWADNDPDENNHHTPVMAANDGASGVAVMMEIARLISKDTLSIGVDFICFDAEDWGTPQWSDITTDEEVWALGAYHWAGNHHKEGYEARYGILLDMVGGQGARFYQEGLSAQNAKGIVDKIWAAAEVVGYGSFFPRESGGWITDDHVPLNEIAKIPTVDIIPHYPDCKESSFGPTWHTVSDDMEHIDKNTLKAVGQTVIQVLYSEK